MEIKIKDSKNISRMFYLESLKELWVFFKSNSTYVYTVDKTVAQNLYVSENPSQYFYDNIRDTEFRKVY